MSHSRLSADEILALKPDDVVWVEDKRAWVQVIGTKGRIERPERELVYRTISWRPYKEHLGGTVTIKPGAGVCRKSDMTPSPDEPYRPILSSEIPNLQPGDEVWLVGEQNWMQVEEVDFENERIRLGQKGGGFSLSNPFSSLRKYPAWTMEEKTIFPDRPAEQTPWAEGW